MRTRAAVTLLALAAPALVAATAAPPAVGAAPPATSAATRAATSATANAATGVAKTASRAGQATADRPAVIGHRVIGRSVRGRAIHAWRVGDRNAQVTAVVMGVMHGNEPAPRQIIRSIRDGAPVRGLDLWLLPTVNPDGLVRHTRKNAHGVDLNRNFPYRWADLDGSYESGRTSASERETRVLMRFFEDVRPRYVVSFHQPLHGVDTSVPEARPFAYRLARHLDLPRKRLVCGGVCHGTFTEWFMHRFAGKAVTVEYGDHPSRHRMRVTAPRQLIAALGGRR